MKVGILTFPHSPSIGAMLQMGSLYYVIKEMGHDVEIINYVSDKVNHKQKNKLTPRGFAVGLLSRIFVKSAAPSYKAFEAQYNMFPELPSFSEEALNAIEERFDRIIVGSDQVWNPVVTGNDMNFYLSFCNDSAKKASYAASFGYTEIPDKDKNRIAELLNDFSYLGVREKQGGQLVKELTGRDATCVLDPTLLVDSQYLRSMANGNGRKNKYVLFFCIKPSPNLYKRAADYAERYGLELVTVGGRLRDRFDYSKHPAFGIGPSEFLTLVDSAECVFTNSFHGTAISIALHTDFYVEFSSDTNSRLISLTETLELTDRVVCSEELKNVSIDFAKVDDLLEIERRKSFEFLSDVLAER